MIYQVKLVTMCASLMFHCHVYVVCTYKNCTRVLTGAVDDKYFYSTQQKVQLAGGLLRVCAQNKFALT